MTRVVRRKAPAAAPVAPMDSPYSGLDPETMRPVDSAMPHLLVSGTTGSGKSRGVLAPAVLTWGQRPVVCVSSKADLVELTIRAKARHGGPVYLMDLSGEVPDSSLQGVPVTKVISDPTALITGDDAALELAALLMEVGSLGGGDGGGGGGGGDSFWKSLAMRPLAAILQAAASYEDPRLGRVDGGGIAWALAACEDADDRPPAEPDPETGEKPPLDLGTPCWDTAIHRGDITGSFHSSSLLAAKKMDPKQRDSVGINMRVALSAWALRAVAGRGDAVPFRPAMLEEPGACLYIVSPLAGPAAPAASATLTALVNHWRVRVGKIPALLMVIDELPNTSPIPRLAAWIGEARGLGIRIVAAVQATSQFEPRWGSSGLKVLRDIFPATLILHYSQEQELLEAAAWKVRSSERTTASLDAGGRSSHSRAAAATMDGAELLPPPGHGRLLIAGRPGKIVKLVDIAHTDLI